ncbi:MAG: hypothetical protein A2479_01330 [Candidatus Magasanikbacteria bacterium RIFOXYC2_FULL_39_8]|nr:MAG: hypothetical protein A2479_01330 [Candidatus Magasanikbacteria bacterium RIFOXYC2_FULL_39_8]
MDRPVEGIVIFARTSKGASRLSEQIRNRTFKKTYHALVEGTPQKASDTLIHYIKKNTKTNIVVAYEKECPESLYAELSYEVVKSNTLYSLIAIKLKTGRPHQIRAQMSAIGCPIVGDTKYGSSTAYHVGSLALCATEVSFQLPTKEEIKTISIPIPEKWNTYI